MRAIVLGGALFLGASLSTPEVRALEPHVACQQDPKRLRLRSRELAEIVKADRDERQDWLVQTPDDMMRLADRDVLRRKRVGEIFGEGCFLKAQDYAAAALVYQHGDSPDHFFQTYIWSKRGMDLGDKTQERMMALGIDRYLISIGRKQLFGSQASKPPESKCWCLQKVERSFPDKRRAEAAGKNLVQAFDWLKELNKDETCANTECDVVLKPTLKGSVPGFW